MDRFPLLRDGDGPIFDNPALTSERLVGEIVFAERSE